MRTYRHFGVMMDVSRNAVMKVSALKRYIDKLEAMGYNMLELYAEDTYKVDSLYFGYLRGGYSGEEIREIDAYAKAHGVELVPCIQTLAHFTNLLKLPAYEGHVDFGDILLAGDEKTYALLDKIFAFCAENFTSRFINIGMDEAHMIGLGRYLDNNGFTNRYEILTKHLNRVSEIAKRYGFTPHMWSDMFFRLLNGGDYYGSGLHIPEEVRAQVPENVELTYWDYYHTKEEYYEEMFRSHEEFGRRIWFAGGAWTWAGFAPNYSYTFRAMKLAMKKCMEHNIEDVIITMWGDDGGACSMFSIVPALYAVRRYADGEFDDKKIRAEYEEKFGVNFNDMMKLELPNMRKDNDGLCVENPCTVMLYNDCFLGLLDKEYENMGAVPFAEYEKILREAMPRVGEYRDIFESLSDLCAVDAVKAELGIRTRKAYRAGDRQALEKIIPDYEKTEALLEKFYRSYRKRWFAENKPFGWEVMEVRLGGVMLRTRSCKERLKAYLAGEVKAIPELEEEILPYRTDKELEMQPLFYRRLASVSEL